MVYLRVQPAGVNSVFSRSVYALWSAYGITCPRLLSWLVLVTRHSMTRGSNGTSSSSVYRLVSSWVNRFDPSQVLMLAGAGPTSAPFANTAALLSACPLGPVMFAPRFASWFPCHHHTESCGAGFGVAYVLAESWRNDRFSVRWLPIDPLRESTTWIFRSLLRPRLFLRMAVMPRSNDLLHRKAKIQQAKSTKEENTNESDRILVQRERL